MRDVQLLVIGAAIGATLVYLAPILVRGWRARGDEPPRRRARPDLPDSARANWRLAATALEEAGKCALPGDALDHEVAWVLAAAGLTARDVSQEYLDGPIPTLRLRRYGVRP